MAGDKRISGQEERLLAALIENNHPGVMTAYTNYAATQVWYRFDEMQNAWEGETRSNVFIFSSQASRSGCHRDVRLPGIPVSRQLKGF